MTETLAADAPQADTTPPRKDEPFLVVENLSVQFPTYNGLVQAVTALSYTVQMGETLGIVGESGSGKSVSSMAVLGLHDSRRTRIAGSIRVNGNEIIGAGDSTLRKIRGSEVAMIFQDPLTALHPFYTVGHQIIEAYRVHNQVSKRAARARAIEMLDRVGIPQPDRRVNDYVHQFSGGMRQRAMIAMALINDPKLLIADEPTTALDVTVQAQILDLMQELQKEFGSAVVIITHDLGVIAELADDTLVMYAGRAVEHGPTKEVLTHPHMPYTWGPARQRRRRDLRHQQAPGPNPGHPPEPPQPADWLPVPPALPLPGQCRRQPLCQRTPCAAPKSAR